MNEKHSLAINEAIEKTPHVAVDNVRGSVDPSGYLIGGGSVDSRPKEQGRKQEGAPEQEVVGENSEDEKGADEDLAGDGAVEEGEGVAQEAEWGEPTPEVLQERLEALWERTSEWRDARKETYALYELAPRGFSALVKHYGPERVLEAMRARRDKKQIYEQFDLVNDLAPTKQERSELYDEMEADLAERVAVLRQWEDEHGWHVPHMGYEDRSSHALATLAGWDIDAYRARDTILGKLRIVGHRTVDLMQDGYINDLSNLVQNSERSGALVELYAEHDNDTYAVIEALSEQNDATEEQLEQEYHALQEEAESIMRKKRTEADMEFAQWRAQVLGDLANFPTERPDAEEVRTALTEALDKIEQQIAQREQEKEARLVEELRGYQEVLEQAYLRKW